MPLSEQEKTLAAELQDLFGDEFSRLERGSKRVLDDYRQAMAYGEEPENYRDNIGLGNLQAYADTLMAGKRK